MKRLLVQILIFREWLLEAQQEVIEDTIATAPARLRIVNDQLRKVRSEIAHLTPASTLLAQALKRRTA